MGFAECSKQLCSNLLGITQSILVCWVYGIGGYSSLLPVQTEYQNYARYLRWRCEGTGNFTLIPLVPDEATCCPRMQGRFESPPAAMATKNFQNEELQHCVELVPNKRYVVEVQANTSAP